ncbi:unnamed protein product [Soboliphyme baturini]|uniref:Uncharacterized protein n=1 Tax=Soboliphyme baturini TaxID=241478 RepID=A0A183IDJ3_9BILA|nr:unnamed protein product [Soboliphyme baturini]
MARGAVVTADAEREQLVATGPARWTKATSCPSDGLKVAPQRPVVTVCPMIPVVSAWLEKCRHSLSYYYRNSIPFF